MTDWGFWTFVATGLYAVISFLQWRAIARQAELTEQIIAATNRATDAANRNATAAFDNAEAAKRNADAAQQSAEALKILNRQWIDVSVFKFEMTAGGPRFEFVLVNRTKLPLTLNRIVVLTSSADALDVPLGDKPIAPDDEHSQLFDLIQTDVVGDWADGKRVEMDVIAAIYFTDAFGERQRQLAGRYLVRQARGEVFLSRYQQGVAYSWNRARARHPEIDTGDIEDRLSDE